MKVLKDEIATLKRKHRVTVELDHGETLMTFQDHLFYRLGYPIDEVVSGEYITSSEHVIWCSLEQRWVS